MIRSLYHQVKLKHCEYTTLDNTASVPPGDTTLDNMEPVPPGVNYSDTMNTLHWTTWNLHHQGDITLDKEPVPPGVNYLDTMNTLHWTTWSQACTTSGKLLGRHENTTKDNMESVLPGRHYIRQ